MRPIIFPLIPAHAGMQCRVPAFAGTGGCGRRNPALQGGDALLYEPREIAGISPGDLSISGGRTNGAFWACPTCRHRED